MLNIFLPLLLSGIAFAQHTQSNRYKWNRPVKPFRIIGNVYYVGAEGVSAFLITSPEGHFLLDGGFSETAPLIERNVVALGFPLHQVRYLLNSHAHFDHCGGLAALKRDTGARLVASAADAPALNAGHQLRYGKGQIDARFPSAKVDRLITSGDTLTLGSIVLTAHLTPGHTRGCTSWSMPVSDHGHTYQVLFFCSTTVAGNDLVDNPKYPQIVSDYERSFALLFKLPCDVFLAPHPEFFHMKEKRQLLDAGQWDAFVNPAEKDAFITHSEGDFRAELAVQTSALRSP